MLKLADGTDAMREVITDQMMMAFEILFQPNKEMVITSDSIHKFLIHAPHVDTSLGCSNSYLKGVRDYIYEMYSALRDKSYEYTFNAYASFLIDEILLVLNSDLRKNKKSWSCCSTKDILDRVTCDCADWIIFDNQVRIASGDEPLDVEFEIARLVAALQYLPALSAQGEFGFILYKNCDFFVYYGTDAYYGQVPLYTSQRYSLAGALKKKRIFLQ